MFINNSPKGLIKHAGNAQLQTLRSYLETTTNVDARAQLQDRINKLEAEIKRAGGLK